MTRFTFKNENCIRHVIKIFHCGCTSKLLMNPASSNNGSESWTVTICNVIDTLLEKYFLFRNGNCDDVCIRKLVPSKKSKNNLGEILKYYLSIYEEIEIECDCPNKNESIEEIKTVMESSYTQTDVVMSKEKFLYENKESATQCPNCSSVPVEDKSVQKCEKNCSFNPLMEEANTQTLQNILKSSVHDAIVQTSLQTSFMSKFTNSPSDFELFEYTYNKHNPKYNIDDYSTVYSDEYQSTSRDIDDYSTYQYCNDFLTPTYQGKTYVTTTRKEYRYPNHKKIIKTEIRSRYPAHYNSPSKRYQVQRFTRCLPCNEVNGLYRCPSPEMVREKQIGRRI